VHQLLIFYAKNFLLIFFKNFYVFKKSFFIFQKVVHRLFFQKLFVLKKILKIFIFF